MIFNVVVDMLTVVIKHVKSDCQIEGVIPQLVDGGFSILQYTDGTILFTEPLLEKCIAVI
jgi:hypothetical protein